MTTARERVNAVTVSGKRHYELEDGTLVPSVTTFLDVLPKPALDKWKLKTVAGWAYDHVDDWKNLPREAGINVIKDSVWYDSTARDAGDIAHRIMELRAMGKSADEIDIPPGFEGASENWDRFAQDYDVQVLYLEPQLLNTEYRYSGSADVIAVVNGEISLLDYKSGNGLYGSTAYQLTAYAMCDTIITPEGDIPSPEVTRLYGLWIRPEGYALYPMEFSQDTWDVVRAARRLFDLTQHDWKYRGKPVNEGAIKSVGRQWGTKGDGS